MIWFLVVYLLSSGPRNNLIHSEMMSSRAHCLAAKKALDRNMGHRVRSECIEMSKADLPKLDSDKKHLSKPKGK